jgi:hypothetical protein
MAILNNSNAISTTGGYDINNSLRFRSSASAYLNRTPASAGSRTTWTWSGWVKRGTLGASAQALFGAGTSGTVYDRISFESDSIRIVLNNGTGDINTTAVFRDPSAWYHVVVAFDTTQATASNRVKIYVNGTQITAFATATYPSQNYTTNINNNVITTVGALYVGSYGTYFDGYMAETYFIDGSQKAASDFGETDTTTGSWKPKAYTGTYGTNGFYLKFSDIATTSGSNAGLGKDFSGNANYWTTNNISVTAGTTYDAMIDSPTLTSATVANYCVMNAAAPYGAFLTLSEANLKSTCNGAYWAASPATIGVSSGKWYWEVTVSNNANSAMIGIAKDTDLGATTGQNVYPGVSANSYGYIASGDKYNNATGAAYGASFTTGDIIGVALNMDAGTLTYYKNNTSQGTAFSSLSGTYLPSLGVNTSATALSVNFGQRPFTYTPPTGFVRLNTFNLPDSTIKAGNSGFGVLTYTGNGSTSVTRSDTNAVNFTPDFVWIKSRSSTNFHNLYDVNRIVSGDHKRLYSNATNAEESSTFSGATNLNGFVSGGFTTGSGGDTNTNAATYVAWCWDANGSPVSNTSGSITSTVSVNATAGFSIVTYTGTGANATVGHGLGVAPSWIIVKGRSGAGALNWMVYQKTMTAFSYNYLNLTNAKETNSGLWNNTEPTSTVFSLGPNDNLNNSTSPYVAYCWAEIAGFSKFGSYTGNGSADGPFVYLGFRPKFILFKDTTTSSFDWIIYDSSRNTYNAVNLRLNPNTSNAEFDVTTNYPFDFLSNGFKIRGTNGTANSNGNTYIYAAFAENPFKNANAR